MKELKEWLECRMEKAVSDEEKVFTFEESLYIRNRLEQHEFMNSFMCRLWKEQLFIRAAVYGRVG